MRPPSPAETGMMDPMIVSCLRHHAWLAIVLLCCATLNGPAAAAGWSVAPIRVHFDGRARTAALSVESTNQKSLDFQVRLMRWSQDEHGQDRYEPSEDLLYFPRQLSLPPGEQRVIRIGLKSPLPEREKAYRLFIEELPQRNDENPSASQIAVRLRFAVPVMVAPRQPRPQATLAEPHLQDGQLNVRVTNNGNRHLRFEDLQVLANDKVIGTADGWYLLAGASRSYRIKLDPSLCRSHAKADIHLQARTGLALRKTFSITPDQCAGAD